MTVRLVAVNGATIDPIIAAHSPRSVADRLRDSRKIIAKHNGDQARIEALMRSQPGPTARRFRHDLANMPPLVAAEHRHVIVHPSMKPTRELPLYDQAAHDGPRIPEGLQLPLSVLRRNHDKPGSISADAVIAAWNAIDEYNPIVVVEGNDPHGMPRPDAFDRATGGEPA